MCIYNKIYILKINKICIINIIEKFNYLFFFNINLIDITCLLYFNLGFFNLNENFKLLT